MKRVNNIYLNGYAFDSGNLKLFVGLSKTMIALPISITIGKWVDCLNYELIILNLFVAFRVRKKKCNMQ